MKKKPRIKIEKRKGEEVIVKDFKKGNRRVKKARYKKAKSTYKQLKKVEQVQIPELIELNDKEQKLTLEKLEPEQKNQEDKKEIVDKLIKFQFSGVKPKESISLKIADNLGVRVFFETILSVKKIGLKNAWGIIKNLIIYYFIYKKLDEEILIHNDLNKGNIIKNDKKIKFLDLESTTISKRWLYKDIVHYAYNFEEQKLDKKLINEYNKQLKQKYPAVYKKSNKNKELQMAILKIFVRKINKRDKRRIKDKQIFFIKHNLLDLKNIDRFKNKQGIET